MATDREPSICLPDGLPFDQQGNPRKRYVRVNCDGGYCVMDPVEADQYKLEAARWEPETKYEYTDVMLSEQEYEALPEFAGW